MEQKRQKRESKCVRGGCGVWAGLLLVYGFFLFGSPCARGVVLCVFSWFLRKIHLHCLAGVQSRLTAAERTKQHEMIASCAEYRNVCVCLLSSHPFWHHPEKCSIGKRFNRGHRTHRRKSINKGRHLIFSPLPHCGSIEFVYPRTNRFPTSRMIGENVADRVILHRGELNPSVCWRLLVVSWAALTLVAFFVFLLFFHPLPVVVPVKSRPAAPACSSVASALYVVQHSGAGGD